MPPDPVSFIQSASFDGDLGLVTTSPVYLAIKFIFIVVTLFFFIHIVYMVYRMGTVGDTRKLYGEAFRRKTAPLQKDDFVSRWQAVKARLATMREADYKIAIIEADKLFDELLKKMTFRGNDMGERLQQISPVQLASLQGVWDSHKIRNKLSHDVGYHITFQEAEKAIQNYENAFLEIGILERDDIA